MNKNNADAPNIASPAPWQGALTRFSAPLLPKPLSSEKKPPNKRFKPTRTSGGFSASLIVCRCSRRLSVRLNLVGYAL
jgi:hypothetical protein